MQCTEESITFSVGEGNDAIALEGLLTPSHPAPTLGAVLCHPHPLYGGEMHNNVVSALAYAFQKENITTLRFNFRGAGRSEGVHGEGVAEREDVKAAVTALLNRQPVSTVVVAGYSFGAMVGLHAGAEDDRVHRLIGVAFPLRFRDPAFLASVTKPFLLVSGDRDPYSPISDLTELIAKIAAPKQLETIRGADHFFLARESEVAQTAVSFLQRASQSVG